MTLAATSSFGISAPTISGPLNKAIPDSRTVEIFDDFIMSSLTTTADAALWHSVTAGSGTTQLSDVAGGAITFTTGATGTNYELIRTQGEFYSFDATKPMYLQAKLQSADLVRAIFVGLVEGSTPGVDNATFLAAAHFGFSIIDTTISFSFGGASATTTDTTADLAAATDVVLTAHYDGDGTWRGYVDGVLKVTSTVTTTNPDELMALCTSVENSATTSASDVQLDYIYFKAEM